MAFNPLEPIEKNDSELFEQIEAGRAMTFGEGALGKKEKLLIAMALDASHGAVNGVRSLASQAMQAGASKQEVMEALRVAGFISGVGSMYTAAEALRDILN